MKKTLIFYGREEILEIIGKNLSGPRDSDVELSESQRHRTYAICGLGGMGKTQIVLNYVFTHRNDYPIIFWAHADRRAKLDESFARFASIGIPRCWFRR